MQKYTPGEWYTVKLVYDFTENSSGKETYDIYINDYCVGYNVTSKYDIDAKFTLNYMRFMEVQHTGTVTERQFSNSYMYDMKGFYPVRDMIVDTKFHFAIGQMDDGQYGVGRQGNYGTNTTHFFGRTSAPEEGATAYKYEATIPTGFDGLERVYMLQSWGKSTNLHMVSGAPLKTLLHQNVILETMVRFDDKNITRKVYQFKDSSTWFDVVKFAVNGVYIDHMLGSIKASKNVFQWEIGKWYNVKLVLHNEGNLYDLYLNDTIVAKDMYLATPITNIERIYYLIHESGDIEETSTSYIQYAKAYYDTESTYQNPASQVSVSGFKKLNTESGLYEDATELTEGKYAVELDILNNESGTTLTPTVILAYYKGDRLVSVDMQSYSAAYPSNLEKTFSVDTAFSGKGEYSLKAFLWNDKSLEPMNAQMPEALSKTVTE